MPYFGGKFFAKDDQSYHNFSLNIRWQQNKIVNTSHLLSIISLANTFMSFKSRVLQFNENITKHDLKFVFIIKNFLLLFFFEFIDEFYQLNQKKIYHIMKIK